MIIDQKRSIKWSFDRRCYIHLRWHCYSRWQRFCICTPSCLSLFVLFRLRRKTSQPTTNQLERFTLRFGFILFLLRLFWYSIHLIILLIDCHSDNYIIMMFEEEDRPTNHKPLRKLCSGCWKTVYHLKSQPPPETLIFIKFSFISLFQSFSLSRRDINLR